MGLDMYLELRKTEYSYSDVDYPEELELFKGYEDKSIRKQTSYEVGYWRKANAIHNWFVNNCAGGEDNCQPIYVEVQSLIELHDICKKVKEDHSLADELLPTQAGFFFGSLAYDEWYFMQLDRTINILSEVIEFMQGKNASSYEVIYQASW